MIKVQGLNKTIQDEAILQNINVEIKNLQAQIEALEEERDFWKSLAENYKLQMNEALFQSQKVSSLSATEGRINEAKKSSGTNNSIKGTVFNMIGDGVNVISSYSVPSLTGDFPTSVTDQKDVEEEHVGNKKNDSGENSGWLW